MAIYAIGDVQGCFDALRRLLDHIRFDPAHDRLWFVGDLVNRGPQSAETLRFVRELGSSAVCVLGNHDLHLLAVAEGHAQLHRGDTLAALLAAPDRDELLRFLRHCPLLHVQGPFVLVHAGLLPQWSVAQAAALAREVEAALQGPRFSDFLAHMYGSHPNHWEDHLTGAARLRVITNAFTRLRFCTARGEMEFAHKKDPGLAPEGFLPWFEVPGRQAAAATIIFGHWSALGLHTAQNLVALDSGCVWGGQLSAFRLDSGEIFQTPCARAQSPAPMQ
ncbi:MAG: symmetrical bis(5'-nucleosyl)-tetraphosphatase [Betaproteobacteria bacterium]|nr:symmetrical bis(5'-nucleosyl)-tetraphosphatase [Betaproteobacteria bacterium]